jgi:RNA polymerase sigma-70 factor, ECF subfamily
VSSHEANDDALGIRVSDRAPGFDADLVARAREGDEAALRSVVDQAYPLVRRWTLVLTGDPADADDLTQDVLVQMIRKLGSFHGDAQFTTWLYAVTRNAATDEFRKRARRRRIEDEDPGVFRDLIPDSAEDPSRAAERAETRELVRTFFVDLPDRQREIFDLVELQDVPAVEVAKRLGIEAVSVRAHLFKARKRMRERILAAYPNMGVEAS